MRPSDQGPGAEWWQHVQENWILYPIPVFIIVAPVLWRWLGRTLGITK